MNYRQGLKNKTDEELISELEYIGCDGYYRDMWEDVIDEIKSRLFSIKHGVRYEGVEGTDKFIVRFNSLKDAEMFQKLMKKGEWIPVTECVYKKGDKRCHVRLDAENTARVSEEAIDGMLNKLGYRLISRLPYKADKER